jgi:hypothetical protein
MERMSPLPRKAEDTAGDCEGLDKCPPKVQRLDPQGGAGDL